jgi:hypothetical protein
MSKINKLKDTGKRRVGWKKFVNAKQIRLRKNIIAHTNKTGHLLPDDGDFLLRFDMKTRVCDRCGKPYSYMWDKVLYTTVDGEKIPYGLAPMCFDCTMIDMIMK